ncbi:ABC transporter permease [Chloroflexota bacterium]
MNKAFIVALHEVRIFLQDKADMAFGLLLPIAVFALMYGAFSGQTIFHGTAHIINEDTGGIYSAILLERLEKLDNLDVELLSLSEAESGLDRSDLLMVVHIPGNFSDSLASGEQAHLIFKQRGNGGQEGQIVASLVRSIAEEINLEFQVYRQVSNAVSGADIPQEKLEAVVLNSIEKERESPIVGVTEETIGSSPDLVNQFLPGIITMFVLFSITTNARTIVEERKKGTLERLLTTRLNAGQLFMGKFLSGISRGFIQTFILLTLAYLVFQLFTPLSFIECLVIALVFSAAACALGLVIASIVRTEDQASWIAVFFTMAMVMLSGTFFEITEGSVMHAMSKISPNTYANDAFRAIIARGGSLGDVGLELGVLAGVIVVGLILSRILFKVVPGGK